MEELLEILRGISPDVDYENSDALIDAGLLDSFDVIALVAELNEAYNISIGAEELVPDNFNSAERIFSMVTRLVSEG